MFSSDNQLASVEQCDTLKACMAKAFHEEIWTDVTFVVGENETHVKSHTVKFVLSQRSSVFRAMFEGPFESNDPITIQDAEEKEFKMFLRYFLRIFC